MTRFKCEPHLTAYQKLFIYMNAGYMDYIKQFISVHHLIMYSCAPYNVSVVCTCEF